MMQKKNFLPMTYLRSFWNSIFTLNKFKINSYYIKVIFYIIKNYKIV